MAKFTRTFVKVNEEMTVQTDSMQEMNELLPKLARLGWNPEKNNWAGLVMATPAEEKPKVQPGECPHHHGNMRPNTKGEGGSYCHTKLEDGKWCGYSTNADGTVKKQSRLSLPIQATYTHNDDIHF